MPTEAGYTDELTQYCPEYFLRRPSGDRRCSLPFVSFALQNLPPRSRQAIKPGNGAWPQHVLKIVYRDVKPENVRPELQRNPAHD
jgi:hypothetical protein